MISAKIAEIVGSVEDEQLWNQKGSLNPGTQSWMEIAARVRIEIASERSGDFYVTDGAACFLTAQSHHRYS